MQNTKCCKKNKRRIKRIELVLCVLMGLLLYVAGTVTGAMW